MGSTGTAGLVPSVPTGVHPAVPPLGRGGALAREEGGMA